MNHLKRMIKKVCLVLFPTQMKIREIRKSENAEENRYREYIKIPKEDYPEKLSQLFFSVNGFNPDLVNPKSFSEKILWRIINDNNPIYSTLSDKYEVRDWVRKKIGDEYLVPLYGVWDDFDEIDFRNLPNSFVLKVTQGSGRNIIVEDKRKLNTRIIREQIRIWMKYPYSMYLYETHYDRIKPRIIAEGFLKPSEGESQIWDYKFICFDGEPVLCWVDVDRDIGHKRATYNMKWEKQNWIPNTAFPPVERNLPKPSNFDQMVAIVRTLSAGFAHVRVDLYETGGRIYFGEMTFTSGAGLVKTDPLEKAVEIGNLWDIHKKQVDEDVVNL